MWPHGRGILRIVANTVAFVGCVFTCQSFLKYEKAKEGCLYSLQKRFGDVSIPGVWVNSVSQQREVVD